MQSCKHTNTYAQDEREKIRQACKLCRNSKCFHHEAHNRLVLRIGNTKIPMEHIGKPCNKLVGNRTIETKLMTHLHNGCLVSHVTNHDTHRISRDNIENKKGNKRDAKNYAYCLKNSLN